MIEENSIVKQPNHTLKQRSLLQKYEIPIDHLSFEYIESCKDVKELEKVLRILRSGEEGYYPDLQKKVEERLCLLSPNNRQLRKEEPVLTRNSMPSNEWNTITSDISDWKNEISLRDLKLTLENNNAIIEAITIPPVRQPSVFTTPNDKTGDKVCSKEQTKRVSDYATWDKYDVDTELLKMDLEEEKREKRKPEKSKEEQNRLEIVVKDAEKLSDTERQVLAEEEKNRGNEYYQAKDFVEAIKYYTASITIRPTAKAYNNRAACYLKQCKYSAALDDANCTLEIEPNNVKALFRRGIALQHKNMFKEALADMNAVLKREPNNVLAQHIAKDLREQIQTLPKTVRLMTDEGLKKPKKVTEMCLNSVKKNHLASNCYEVNEWNLPKTFCQCYGTPKFLQSPPQKCTVPHFQPRPNSAKIIELPDKTEPPRNSTKLDIVEVEKLEPDGCSKPKKCVVVDKRTHKTRTHKTINKGDFNLLQSETKVTNSDSSQGSSSASGDSGMDEDFDINPLLADSPESLSKPLSQTNI